MALPDDLLEPISGSQPGGDSLRYEPIYDEIKEARREDEDLPQGAWEEKRKTADYDKVIKLAGDALANRSKDLQLAAWLTEALLQQKGFSGLHQGLALLHGLIERFWDDLYPELEDGDAEFRASPLSWVGQYLTVAVKSVPLDERGHSLLDYEEARGVPAEGEVGNDADKKAQRARAIEEGKATPEAIEQAFLDTPKPFYKRLVADLKACGVSLDALEKLGSERFGDAEPNYRPLRQVLEEVNRLARDLLRRKLELDPDPPDAEPEEGELAGSAGEAGPGAIPAEPRDARDAANRIAAAAHFLQSHAPTNPASYLLVRGFRWGELRANGRTIDPRLLAAPPTPVRTRLKTLLLDEDWAQLLEEGEKVMAAPYGRGWLDLQRYVLTACFKLGDEYGGVAAAIHGALSALLRDYPQLPGLTLMDDTPTANEETRKWLRSAELIDGDGGERSETVEPVGPVGPAYEPPPSTDAAYEKALAAVRSGRPEQGIELLMRELEREKSERARFLRRSEVASIMVDSGLEGVALPILKELAEAIDNHKLEHWEEGEVVARPLGLLYKCIEKLGGESEEVKKNLYRRICRLDPVQAISFPGGRPKPPAGMAAPAPAGDPASKPETASEPESTAADDAET